MATAISVEVRMYNVGLGDCLLLTFNSSDNGNLEQNRILIDFGSTGRNRNGPTLEQLAHQIVEDCGGPDSELEAVVITHRHKDHMSGFGGNAGDIIVNQLRPSYVLQPWTEEPGADDPSTHPANSDLESAAKHVMSLRMAQTLTDSILNEVLVRRANNLSRPTDDEALFYCQKNLPFDAAGKTLQTVQLSDSNLLMLDGLNTEAIKNMDAIEKVQNWSWGSGQQSNKPKYRYLQKGSRSVPRIPGLKIKVLGPIGVDQWEELEKSGGVDELWKRLQGLRKEAVPARKFDEEGLVEFDESEGAYGVPSIFDEDEHVSNDESRKDSVRWLIEHLDELRGEQLLNFVRVLDEHLNNTSVILMFDFGGFRMLFPGDAEVAAWKSIVKDESVVAALKSVDLYKVGHHGSNNATPILSLWQHMTEDRDDDHTLHCVLSTQPTKFPGSIPNRTLLTTMRDEPGLHLVSTSYPEDEEESEHDADWTVHSKTIDSQQVVMSYSRVFDIE